jgi:O-methyltransferase involved in polyketide biosynthesis
MERNYSNISPSARMLLMMKGVTPIPFAREAAELMAKPEKYIPDYDNKDMFYWMRVMHFEERYTSINQLLDGLDIKNMLELSSGFSFRGLEYTSKHEGIHYIDTDLPGVIEQKKNILEDLTTDLAAGSKLELLPMNAVKEDEFKEVTSHFNAAPITIINEGLLMYLDDTEKKQLCKNIRDLLKERGGYWITADIYTKLEMPQLHGTQDDELSKLVERERIEEKKFESFEQAHEFFEEQGFTVEKIAQPNYMALSSTQYLLKTLPPEIAKSGDGPPRIHETWRLKVAE